MIDESTARADALATAYMILGLEAATVLADRENQAVYFIYTTADTEFDEYISNEFRQYLGN